MNKAFVLGLWPILLAGPVFAEKKLLWGDTHVHSYYSTDSFINQNFTIGPAQAYQFAMGQAVRNPLTDTRIKIESPLDFLVVSDHAESYGIMKRALEEGLPTEGLGLADRLRSWFMTQVYTQLSKRPDSVTDLLKYASPETTDVLEAVRTPAAIDTPNQQLIASETWHTATSIADQYNAPGKFTTLIGWEWSAIPAGANLHRVVFTDSGADVARQWIPFSSSFSSYPQDLWQWLDKTSESTGADFVAIPHNSNISRGYMFPLDKTLRDEPISSDWIAARARWEVAVEATQVKGDSETDPAVSPDDRFADFESYPHYISAAPLKWNPGEGDFVRSALRRGLMLEQRQGQNPYQFGLIGSTDSHTGLANAEETNFWGKFLTDSTFAGKQRDVGEIENFGWAMSASGLAAVWAEDNTREAIFAAFKRREIYATTGPKIAVRVFAGDSFTVDDESVSDIETIRGRGVPMGGELRNMTSAPSFYVEAARDPNSAQLDRVQVIKGWIDSNGATKERVYNVAWSGQRELGSDGSLPTVTQGAASLVRVWVDPDFDASQSAFYYLRVLEVPTPRHSTLDAIALGISSADTGYPETIQERAYTSPIFYRP